jgi:hypothetical protein
MQEAVVWHTTYSGGKLVSMQATGNLFGFPPMFRDSFVFVYNTAGYLVKRTNFINTGGGYRIRYFADFTYVGTNNTEIKTYRPTAVNPLVSELVSTETFAYDNKIAAYSPGPEEFAIGIYDPFSRNNSLFQKIDFGDSTRADVSSTFTYNYGPDGRPITATVVGTGPFPTTSDLVFTYKR